MRMLLALVVLLFLVPTTGGQEKKLPLLFQDDFENGAAKWQPTDAAAWKIIDKDGSKRYNQFQQSKFNPPHRSPLNFSLIKDLVVADFILEAKCQSTAPDSNHRDMCLFFGYQDPAHFYYVHIANKGDDHANQIFIVNGEDRNKISKTANVGNKWDDKWHNLKVVRAPASGKIEIYRDDMKTPIMTAEDKTFLWGQVGIGSFDDTGLWDDVKVYGMKHEKKKL